MSRRRTRLLAVPAAALVALSLVGCDSPADKAEDALKSQGIDADLDGSDGISVEGSDFGVTTGKLPKDFPTDEVAVVSGEILTGQYLKASSTWNVTVKVDDAGGDKQAAYDTAAAGLTNTGAVTVSEPTDNGSAIVGEYTTGSYSVQLAVTDANGVVVNYTVSPK